MEIEAFNNRTQTEAVQGLLCILSSATWSLHLAPDGEVKLMLHHIDEWRVITLRGDIGLRLVYAAASMKANGLAAGWIVNNLKQTNE